MQRIDLTTTGNEERLKKWNKQNKQDKNGHFLLRNDASIDKYIERKRADFHEEWARYVTHYDD